MPKTPLTVLALLLALVYPRVAAPRHFPPSKDLTAMIQKRVEANRGMALVVGVIETDGSTNVVYYGDAGEGARPLGAQSVFEIGSVTKVFTGTLLAEAVARGEVALEDPVAKYLPDKVTVPSRNGREITLLDLATHRSSLTRMPTNIVPTGDGTYATYTIDMMYEYLSNHELRRDIGAEYEYSNIAVSLLGHALERASGKTYEQLLRERILDPLGMRTTSTKVEGEVRKWMTVGHDQRGLVAPYRNWPHLPAMGALRSNAEDLLRFLAANLRTPTSQIERSMRSSHEVRNTADGDTGIGLNWHVARVGDKRVISHGGSTRGFRAYLGFDPDAGVGVVLLANSPIAANDLALHLINPQIPLSDAPVADRFEIYVPEKMLRTYVGEYELRPGFIIDVTVEDGALFVQATGQRKFPVFPESPTKFFARVADLQISFTQDDAGAVAGLVLYQGGGSASAPRRLVAGVPLTAADAPAPLPGRRTSLDSGVLGEERPLRIVTPRGYGLSMSILYPVMLVLDGEVSLHHASNVASSLATDGRAPEMIVVHTPSPAHDQRSAFSEFVTDELRPWVGAEHRTAAFTVIVGDAETIAFAPDSFGSLTVGPDGSLRASFRGARTSSEGSADPHVALRDGLAWLFEGWELADIETLASQVGGAGWAKIDAHFAELSDRFGYRVVPHENLADVGGLVKRCVNEIRRRPLDRCCWFPLQGL